MDQQIKEEIKQNQDQPLPQTNSQKTNSTITQRNLTYLVFVVCSLCLSPFYYGYTLSFISTVNQETAYRYFGIDKSNFTVVQGFLLGIMPLGAAIGTMITPFALKRLSRKDFLLFFNAVALIISGLLQINVLPLLFVCRFFQGIVIGNFMGVTPVYIKQLSPLRVRGRLGALIQLFAIFGTILVYIFGVCIYQPSQFYWRFVFSFTGITVLTQSLLLIFNFIPQSPVSLIQSSQFKQARRVLAIFNSQLIIQSVFTQYVKLSKWSQYQIIYKRKYSQQSTPRSKKQRLQITNNIQMSQRVDIKNAMIAPDDPKQFQLDQRKNTLSPQSIGKQQAQQTKRLPAWTNYTIKLHQVINTEEKQSKVSIRAVVVGFQVPIMQPLSGSKVIVTQIEPIMQQLFPYLNATQIATIPLVINIVQFVTTIFSIPAFDHFGRRPLLVAGNFATATISFLIGLFFLLAFQAQNHDQPNNFNIVSLIFIVLFMMVYGFTIGPGVWLYVPQIIPPNLVAPATCTNWLGVAFSVMVAPIIITAVGSPYAVFFIFAGISYIFFFINFFNLMQTKGLKMSQIQQKFA